MTTLLDMHESGAGPSTTAPSGDTLGGADIVRILELLPHRYPFLLVDRIIGMRSDEACVGIKNVSFNEPQFQGHFPGKPVFPGVLIIEGMAQTAGALCVWSQLAQKKPPSKVFFMTIDNAKFRRPVEPGDVLQYHMTKLRNRRNMWWFRGEATVDGVLAAEAEVSAMLVTE
jgi:3-hydroxyacyl-[acyl-carrier-protein] dehydratase